MYVLCWERWVSSLCSLAKGININAPSCPTFAWSLTNGEMAVTPKLPSQHSGTPVAFSQIIVQTGLALWKPGEQLTCQKELGSSLYCPLLSPSFLADHYWLGSVASLAGFQIPGDPPVISFFLFELLYTWQARNPLDLLKEHWENPKDKEHCPLCGKNEWLEKDDGIKRRSQKIWYDQKAHTKAGSAAASKNKLLTKWSVCAIIVTWKSGPVIYGMLGDKQKVHNSTFEYQEHCKQRVCIMLQYLSCEYLRCFKLVELLLDQRVQKR